MCVTKGHTPDTKKRFGMKVDHKGFGGSCFNCGFKFKYEYHKKQLSKPLKSFMRQLGVKKQLIDEIKYGLFEDLHSGVISDLMLEPEPEETEVPFAELFKDKKPKLNEVAQSLIKDEKQIRQILRTRITDNVMPEFNEFSTRYVQITKRWSREHSYPGDAKPMSYYLDRAELGHPIPADVNEGLLYMYERDLLEFDDICWSYAVTKEAGNRIILPFEFGGKRIGYTARAVNDRAAKIKKYHSMMPDDAIFNYHLFHNNYKRTFAVLYEGVIDAYVMQGMACGGRNINDDQIYMIKNLGMPVIVVPDNDKDGDDLIDIAIREGWSVSFPPWKHKFKDAAAAAAKYGRIYTIQSILASVETNPLTINLKKDMNV